MQEKGQIEREGEEPPEQVRQEERKTRPVRAPQPAQRSCKREQQQRENDSLSSALEKADDPEYLQELAREQLDMVSPGEKVFYDVSN